MDKDRFSLLLLDPGEIYFEDFSAVLISSDVTIKTIDSKKIDGRLKLCSKSLVFDTKDAVKPLIKIPLKECSLIEKWKGSIRFIDNNNVFRVECTQYIEMLERNILAPYKFCENGKFIIALDYADVSICLDQIHQLKRASTLPAIDQANMIAAIVHSRHSRIKFDHMWMDLNEKILMKMQANKITPLVVNPGRLVLTTMKLYFQAYNNVEMYPVKKININNIQRIFKRRFLLRHIGLEIYYISDESNKENHIYLSALDENERNKLYMHLLEHPELKLNSKDQDTMTLQWQNGVISNYEYIMYINSLGDRSKNDLTQYPVFPWVILDYTSKTIDLQNEKIYRDLSKPMGALNETRLNKLMDRYEEMSEPKFIYGSHYSTPGFVLFYLVRLYPHYMLCLQNGRFDHPDRMFNSCAHLCKNSLNDMSDFKELIPEFYDLDEEGRFLVNNLGVNFGYRHTGVKVGDVELPAWAESPKHFVQTLRSALESDFVSQKLHLWIDLIFGYKQRGEEAVNAKNLFYYLCYEGSVDYDGVTDLNDRHTLEVQIMEFGQIPRQVFKRPHPKRRVGLSIVKQLSTEVPEILNEDTYGKWKNIKSLELQSTFATHKDKVSCLFISEDGEKIISVGHDSKLKVFSIINKRQIRSSSIGNMPLSSCIKLPNLNVLIIGSFSNEIIIYDMDFDKVKQTVTAHDDALTCMTWATTMHLLCSGSSDCTVCIWKGLSQNGEIKCVREMVHHLDHSSHVSCMCFDNDNHQLAVGTEDGEVYIWNIDQWYSTLKEKHSAHTDSITSISYSCDGLKLITCSLDKSFQVLDINTGMSLYRKKLPSALMCMKWDAFLLVLGSQDGILYIWNIIEVTLLHEIRAHKGAILTLDISIDRNYIVTGGEDHMINVWNLI